VALRGVVVLLGPTVAGLYLSANWPPRPGFLWVAPYPTESPDEMRRKAESSPAVRDAMTAYEQQRLRVVFQALAVWLVTGTALLGVATTVEKGLHRRPETSG
jgi:hypothetical protein